MTLSANNRKELPSKLKFQHPSYGNSDINSSLVEEARDQIKDDKQTTSELDKLKEGLRKKTEVVREILKEDKAWFDAHPGVGSNPIVDTKRYDDVGVTIIPFPGYRAGQYIISDVYREGTSKDNKNLVARFFFKKNDEDGKGDYIGKMYRESSENHFVAWEKDHPHEYHLKTTKLHDVETIYTVSLNRVKKEKNLSYYEGRALAAPLYKVENGDLIKSSNKSLTVDSQGEGAFNYTTQGTPFLVFQVSTETIDWNTGKTKAMTGRLFYVADKGTAGYEQISFEDGKFIFYESDKDQPLIKSITKLLPKEKYKYIN